MSGYIGSKSSVTQVDGYTRSEADAVAQSVAMPAGSVIWYASDTAPTGYIKANGATVSRTTYADLFAAIGTTFGVGDGSTTFQIPDLRGEFVRGWDDSRGVDSGRAFGSAQSFAMQNITGSVYVRGAELKNQTGVFSVTTGASVTIGGTASATLNVLNIDASAQVQTASETRPRNIAMLACIKY